MFDPEFQIPYKYVRDMRTLIQEELDRQNLTKGEFIKQELDAYKDLSLFIPFYQKYCIQGTPEVKKIDYQECDNLVRVAPKIGWEFKEVLMVMSREIQKFLLTTTSQAPDIQRGYPNYRRHGWHYRGQNYNGQNYRGRNYGHNFHDNQNYYRGRNNNRDYQDYE